MPAKSDKELLNAYIYDYLLKHNMLDSARTFGAEAKVVPNVKKEDDKELPKPLIPIDAPQGFLYEWWALFWDIYSARGSKGGGSVPAQQYVQGTMRLRQEHAARAQLQQQHQAQQHAQAQAAAQVQGQGQGQGSTPGQGPQPQGHMGIPGQGPPQPGGPFLNGNMMFPPGQMRMGQLPQHLQQQGNAAGSNPSDDSSSPGGNSPAKRQRLSPDINNQPHPEPQGQHMMGTPNPNNNPVFNAQMMQQLKASQGQMPNLQSQQQAQLQQYSNTLSLAQQRAMMNAKGGPNGQPGQPGQPGQAGQPGQPGQPGQGQPLPMGYEGMEPGFMGNGLILNAQMRQQGGNGGAAGSGQLNGNSNALHDYQMQLMLLEQQNKKRLMVARQEQQEGQPRAEGQGANPNARMSGQFKRPGSSPVVGNIGDGRRVTPKLPNQPSPLIDANRASPLQSNFNGQGDFNVVVGPNGQMMRMQQPGQPGQQQGGPPQQQQQQQPQQQHRFDDPQQLPQSQNGGPQAAAAPGQLPQTQGGPQRPPSRVSQMPPPGVQGGQRTQPSSPGQTPNPGSGGSSGSSAPGGTTPTQANKQLKGKKSEPKKRAKKGGQPVTPKAVSESPTPTTPATPSAANNQSLLSKATTFAASNKQAQAQAQAQQAHAQAAAQAQSQMHMGNMGGVASSGLELDVNGGMGLDNDPSSFLNDFSTGNEGDVGDMDFDFNSFLNTDDNAASALKFDSGSAFGWGEGVEAMND